MHRGVLGHTIVHLKLSGPLIPRHVCLGFPSSSHMSFCAGTRAATSILSPKSGSEKEKIKMQREGMFSPLDELFYNKLPAGVRKREICGFQLTRKLKLEGSWEDLLNPTQSFVSVLVFLGKHSSLSASPPSFLGSHSTWAQSPPGELQLLASAECLPCCLHHHLQPSQKVPGDGKKREAAKWRGGVVP